MSIQIESTPITTTFGNFELYCLNWGSHADENIICLKAEGNLEHPLIRIQSACFTSEIFKSTDCDCHEQLVTSLQKIQASGGYLFYLLQEGRGAGIFQKIKGLKLGITEGLDTVDAYLKLGIDKDLRTYDKLAPFFEYFGIKQARLLTNNPSKINALTTAGVTVERVPLEICATSSSLSYLKTKRDKMGHLLNLHP